MFQSWPQATRLPNETYKRLHKSQEKLALDSQTNAAKFSNFHNWSQTKILLCHYDITLHHFPLHKGVVRFTKSTDFPIFYFNNVVDFPILCWSNQHFVMLQFVLKSDQHFWCTNCFVPSLCSWSSQILNLISWLFSQFQKIESRNWEKSFANFLQSSLRKLNFLFKK